MDIFRNAPHVIMHRLVSEPERHPVKQAPSRMHLDLIAKLKAEVDKLVKDGFIREVKSQLAGIVEPVKKNNTKFMSMTSGT